MAYIPTNPGWGATATVAKKKPPAAAPKPARSFDPSGALGGFTPQQIASMTPSQLAQLQFGLAMQGPPAPDFEKLRAFATAQAQQQASGPASFYQQERDYQAGRQRMSSEAATNFSAAFANILQGNKTGAEGEQYALETFGGSYLGGIAARMGQELIARQQEHFTELDMKLAGQLADIMDAIPDEAEKIYKDLVDRTQDILTAPYQNQIAAIGALIKNKRDEQKAAESAAGKSADGKVTPFTRAGGEILGLDTQTGKVVYRIPGAGGKSTTATGDAGTINGSASGKPISFSAASTYARSMTSNTGTLWKVRKTKNGFEAYDTGKPKAGGGGTVGTAPNGGKVYAQGSAYDVLNGLSAARQSSEIFKWKKIARETAVGSVKLKKTYQESLSVLTGAGVPLDIAQAALNKYWKRGETKPWEKAGQGRPAQSWQERNPGKAKAARAAATTTAVVTPKTGIVTSTPWKGTHVTDNLDWNHGQKTAADIMGAPGTPVGAPEDGTVVRWGSAQGGQALYFQGVSGRRYWLGHIDSMAPVGTKVLANQPIAMISGDHPRPHLHIDVTGGSV